MNISFHQPFGLFLSKVRAQFGGSVREKIRYGILPRANYAYGLLRAADLARLMGKRRVTVCEFGVAEGEGLLNMIHLAERIGNETGVAFRIVGFDSGEGLPELQGYKDHPEIWARGDFPVTRPDKLEAQIAGKAERIIGDIRNTVQPFVDSLSEDAPLGFVAVDVDLYSSARECFRCFLGAPTRYTPAVSLYLDDTCSFFSNKWCGELAAVEEFNRDHESRKIDGDYTLPGTRPGKFFWWYRQMFVCHILDHPIRNSGQGGWVADKVLRADFERHVLKL